MNTRLALILTASSMLVALHGGAMAETVNFDQQGTGVIPSGWKCGVTGRGSPKWSVEKDDSAPSPPNVLKQAGSGTFPWCVKTDVSNQRPSRLCADPSRLPLRPVLFGRDPPPREPVRLGVAVMCSGCPFWKLAIPSMAQPEISFPAGPPPEEKNRLPLPTGSS